MNHVDNPFESPVILSLCTGMRGLERGLERAIGSITIAAYVEIEAFIIFNLVRQMEQGVVDAAPVWTDIKTFPSAAFHRKIHWIIGGYPCQPFSVAGHQKGTDDPRHIWPYIKEAVRIIRPFGCFFENVPNHINIGYREVRQDLEELGYTVKEGLYTAEEVGAPHERKRLFILAIKLGNPCSIGECKQDAKDGSFPFERNSWTIIGSASENKLADSNEPGLEGRVCSELQQCPGELLIREGDSQAWPAGQGEYQHSWEKPRTVKSGLGCTVNGYNFRTDLLRMYGNGVVEQTAELAFIDLLIKHRANLL